MSASALLLASCGKGTGEHPSIVPGPTRDAEAESLLGSDPGGPIPRPRIPSSLSSRDMGLHRDRAARGKPLSYTVDTVCEELPEAAETFKEVAELYTLSDRPVYSRLTLARRLRKGLSQGEEVLQSLGYYDGVAEGAQTQPEDGGPIRISITLTPGPLYHVGGVSFLPSAEPEADPAPAEGASAQAPGGATRASGGAAPGGAAGTGPRGGAPERPEAGPLPELPPLELKGVKAGDPAVAGRILDAVGEVDGDLADAGHPFARVTATRYWLDKDSKLLYIEASVYPGEFVRMGPLEIRGDNPTKPGFVDNYVNWKRGEAWDQDRIEAFRDALFQTGLFKPVTVEAGAPSGPDGEREVLLTMSRAPLRTVSGSVNYDSDFGPGLEVNWEHRNFTGWGDTFRVDLPVWKDLQQLGLQYSRPHFLSPRQKFLARSAVLREETDTFSLQSLSASAGIERPLSRHLTGQLMASVEAGRLDEFVTPERRYTVWGFPLTLDWNWSDSLLNPTRGHRLSLLAAPYMGRYFTGFQILKARADAYKYVPLMDDGRLVLALRASVGSIFGAGPATLPASLRFFSGGGGSVRGFRYRAIGPRNSKDKPAGGDFLTEVSGEFRWRFSETMGVVAFIDGGNLYDKADFSQFGKDVLWGGGLGFRYYSPMGPFRLDLAYPLKKGDLADNSRLQFYISLGQSF
ncbi:MAG: BamA/TamA family outer membrane protein [Deltaproteobacteria bacterium]|nr:BamA/TamA family outer membrane protein [Deltaproteobacteria bacterium]